MAKKLVIVGAGIGGLTSAAVLARAGLDVTVLEAHIYPGGSAGTFYHKGYLFDAGATLAGGFYPGGPMTLVAQAAGIEAWPVRASNPNPNPAMAVHLPDGTTITRWTDERRWEERRRVFGAEAETFWRWQERTADQLWNFALRQPTWPPQTHGEAVRLVKTGLNWLVDDPVKRLNPALIADAFRPAAHHLRGASDRLRLFVDGQLLISAQATSQYTNALYSASALDLPRRGVVHTEGGMGEIAGTLAQAILDNGGQILYRKQVNRIVQEGNRPVAVEINRGESFPADIVIANLTPWNIRNLLADSLPPRLQRLPERPQTGWGCVCGVCWAGWCSYPRRFSPAPPGDRPGTTRRRELDLHLDQPGVGSASRSGRPPGRNDQHSHPAGPLVGFRSPGLRNSQSRLYQPHPGCRRNRPTSAEGCRRIDHARNAGHVPAIYPAAVGLGRRIPTD